ncbi:hypothetical protein [Okeania sp. SIO2B3]|uniref:hypothetical protein n=1 Tax=Okeania sp. SIO2B3 TaxID=2607784 RepID=UPI0013C1C6CA|nr:hypothetical protein [Okeania sp. SIO2B3]NET45869.1 hypothetical protein [Okeania sp. SIO2B3]
MIDNNSKYSYVRIKYKTGGTDEILFNYLKQKDEPLKSIILEALEILWLPYALTSVESSPETIHNEVELSYQKFINHFQLMCLMLGCKSLQQPLAVTNQAQLPNGAKGEKVDEEEELDDEQQLDKDREIFQNGETINF